MLTLVLLNSKLLYRTCFKTFFIQEVPWFEALVQQKAVCMHCAHEALLLHLQHTWTHESSLYWGSPSVLSTLSLVFQGFRSKVFHITCFLILFSWRWQGLNLGSSASKTDALPLSHCSFTGSTNHLVAGQYLRRKIVVFLSLPSNNLTCLWQK